MFEHKHVFSRWEPESQADLKINGRVVGRSYIQKRVCSGCGFVECNIQNLRCDAETWDGPSLFERVFWERGW